MDGGVAVSTVEELQRQRYGCDWKLLVEKVAKYTSNEEWHEKFKELMREGTIVPGGAILRNSQHIDVNKRPSLSVPWANCYIIPAGDCYRSFLKILDQCEEMLDMGAGIAIDISRIPYWYTVNMIHDVQKVIQMRIDKAKPPVITLSGFSQHILHVVNHFKDASAYAAYVNLALCLNQEELDSYAVWVPIFIYNHPEFNEAIWYSFLDIYMEYSEKNLPLPRFHTCTFEGQTITYQIERSHLWQFFDLGDAIQRGRLAINNLTRMLNPAYVTEKEKQAKMQCSSLNVCMEISIPIKNDACYADTICEYRREKNAIKAICEEEDVKTINSDLIILNVPKDTSETDVIQESTTSTESIPEQEATPEAEVTSKSTESIPEPTTMEPVEVSEPVEETSSSYIEPKTSEGETVIPAICILASINVTLGKSEEYLKEAAKILVKALSKDCLHLATREKNIGISLMGLGHLDPHEAGTLRRELYKTIDECARAEGVVRSICQAPLQSTAPLMGVAPSIFPPLRGPSPMYEARMNRELYRIPLKPARRYISDMLPEENINYNGDMVKDMQVYGIQFHSLSAIFWVHKNIQYTRIITEIWNYMKTTENKNIIYYCNRWEDPHPIDRLKRSIPSTHSVSKRICLDCE